MISRMFKRKTPLILFLVPSFAFMTIYLYYPFIMNIYNSFCNIGGLGQAPKGFNSPWFQNYKLMFTDPKMGTSVVNSLIFMVATVVIQVGLALVFAILVDNIKKGANFFRTVYFFPIVISATALGLLFNLLFLYDGGMINQLLMKVFGMAKPVNWKDETHWLFTMLVPVMWQYVGYYFVILIAGLNNISEDIYEAAYIDGCSTWQKVRYITLPLLHNTLCTCCVLAITGSLKVFDMPWVMFPNGMPLDKSWLLGTYMYKQTFVANNVDYGSTIAIMIVVVGVVLSQIANRVFKEKDY